jgi:hypothetical protein
LIWVENPIMMQSKSLISTILPHIQVPEVLYSASEESPDQRALEKYTFTFDPIKFHILVLEYCTKSSYISQIIPLQNSA